MKTGLIMEGGALRALFSAGVIDVMMEHHLKFDGLIGVSAGAAFGCNYKSNQAGRAIRYNKRFAHDTRYCSVRTLLKTGDIFGGEFCYHTLPEQLDIFDQDTFETNPMEFVVSALTWRQDKLFTNALTNADTIPTNGSEPRPPCHWSLKSWKWKAASCSTVALPTPFPSPIFNSRVIAVMSWYSPNRRVMSSNPTR